ncbi:alpha-N-acetylgalactosaminide alpha-2,6-sialyltransferase 1-like isoform X2 [Patiria miniata]|uniref:alpha-N-acetylgalactosaminide alpha-2,6-sialyltransferase n=1 Tax=Patiria miniata TaxID=46514 RepID=A0A913YX58_PATMI|nr:alpha-N-acetylgalactosaminide alpha-2,6-sialyltransferase 1-like isoform X2 [Patiria miniata]
MAFRFKVTRSVKAVMGVALLVYIGTFLVGMMARMHKPTFPWTSDKDDYAAWRETVASHDAILDSKNKENSLAGRRPQAPNRTLVEKLGIRTGYQTEKVKKEERKTVPCPKTVASLAKYSKWFKERYRQDVKLFLDKDDINNYDNLSASGLPFGFRRQNKTVISQILQHKDFSNPPVHGASGKQGCIRCAVVGCGGILNGSEAGEEIDGHDYIFRLNRALSAGKFAKDVGKRTTFYTFFPESQHLTDVEDKNALFFFTLFKAYDADYALNMMNGDDPPNKVRKPILDPKKVKFVHPAFFTYVFKTFLDSKAYRPTTGALVVFLALHICDEITIYGFGYDPRFTMHYYDTKFVVHTNASTGSHDVDNERKLWHKLHEEGVIRLFKRDV